MSKEHLHVAVDQPVKVIGNDPEQIKITVHEALPVKLSGTESKSDQMIVKEPQSVSANKPSPVLAETNDEPLVVTNEAQPSPNEILAVLTAISSVADKNHGK